MKVVRSGVFETNSSSTHSLCIDFSAPLMPQPFSDDVTARGYVEVQGGEYGWDEETFTDLESRLSYVFTSAAARLPDDVDPNNFTDEPRLNLIRDAVKEHAGIGVVFVERKGDSYSKYGYIDHQSSDVPAETFESKENMTRFLFSPCLLLRDRQ